MSKIGVDLVHITQFSEKIRDRALLARLFTDRELAAARGSVETLAGIFAAKEAYFKALHKTPEWHAVEVGHKENGAPVMRSHPRAEVSISHDGNYAVAMVFVERAEC